MKNCSLALLFIVLISHTFAQTNGSNQSIGPAPEYSNLYYWAAHPFKHDLSDSTPSFLQNELKDTSVDVFFLHPTTFTANAAQSAMNADVNDSNLNRRTDYRTILMQGSIFNGSGRVFAPRYRQAHLKAFFFISSPASKQAFDTAYADLKAAFQYYLDHWNHGRPIVIAAHSQGSFHAIRLLQEFFDGKPLQKQLVCAYIPGWEVKKADFKSIPQGTSPTQTGCILTWRTYLNGKTDRMVENSSADDFCVNPISWTTDEQQTSADMHKGAVGREFNTLVAKRIQAAVNKEHHVLWIDGVQDLHVDSDATMARLEQTGNFHIGDLNLFYMDVRENLKLRVKNFMSHPSK